MAEEINDPLSKKIAITPDQTIFTDGAIAPLGNFRMDLKNPVEGRVETVMPFDPATGKYTMPCVVQTSTGTPVLITPDAVISTTTYGLLVLNKNLLFNRLTATWDAARTPATFKLASASAINDTALWTPAGGKKFRIMGFTWTLPNTATTAAGTVITLRDSAADIFNVITIGTTTAGQTASVVLPGNGYLSALVDNVLNIHLSAALTVGVIAFSVYGTEE